jgi:uncharacterized membrane protein
MLNPTTPPDVDARIEQLLTAAVALLNEARQLRGYQPFDAEQFARQLVRSEDIDDSMTGHLERRVAALEEALISDTARTALAAGIRQSVAGFGWAGPDFWSQRLEATAADWLTRDRAAA